MPAGLAAALAFGAPAAACDADHVVPLRRRAPRAQPELVAAASALLSEGRAASVACTRASASPRPSFGSPASLTAPRSARGASASRQCGPARAGRLRVGTGPAPPSLCAVGGITSNPRSHRASHAPMYACPRELQAHRLIGDYAGQNIRGWSPVDLTLRGMRRLGQVLVTLLDRHEPRQGERPPRLAWSQVLVTLLGPA